LDAIRSCIVTLSYMYDIYEGEVQVSHFTVLLQSFLIGLPDDQRLLLTPI